MEYLLSALVEVFQFLPALVNIADTNFHVEVKVKVVLHNTRVRDEESIGKPQRVMREGIPPVRRPPRQVWRDLWA